jgi:AraC-like DNA-binding protein
MSKKRQVAIAGDESILVRSYAVTHPRGLGLPTRSFEAWDQLVFATHGVMTVVTSEGTWVIPPQRALWLPAGVGHAVRMSGRVTLRTLFFRPRSSAGRLPRRCTAMNVSPLVRELVLHVCRLNILKRESPSDRRLAQLVIELLEKLPTEPLHVPLPADARALRAAQRFLATGGAASTHVVAREVGASVRTLERLFARDTTLTLGRWCRRARMTEALRLLADGASVTQTASAVGYQTPSAFVAAFRRELGTTPSQYFALSVDRGKRVPRRRTAAV